MKINESRSEAYKKRYHPHLSTDIVYSKWHMISQQHLTDVTVTAVTPAAQFHHKTKKLLKWEKQKHERKKKKEQQKSIIASVHKINWKNVVNRFRGEKNR